MVALYYVSPRGRRFDLITPGGGYRDVFIEKDTLEGLVGEYEDEGRVIPGMPGQVVDYRDRVIRPMTGGFTVRAMTVAGAEAFRRGWSSHRHGTLWLNTDVVTAYAKVRLAQFIAAPAAKLQTGSALQVKLICDDGVWKIPFESAGGDVGEGPINTGDTIVYPRLRWERNTRLTYRGRGVDVTLSAGAPVVFDSHPMRYGAWNERTGQRDKQLSKSIHDAGFFMAGVAPGSPIGYTVAQGTVLYELGVLDPWM